MLKPELRASARAIARCGQLSGAPPCIPLASPPPLEAHSPPLLILLYFRYPAPNFTAPLLVQIYWIPPSSRRRKVSIFLLLEISESRIKVVGYTWGFFLIVGEKNKYYGTTNSGYTVYLLVLLNQNENSVLVTMLFHRSRSLIAPHPVLEWVTVPFIQVVGSLGLWVVIDVVLVMCVVVSGRKCCWEPRIE